MTDADIIKSHGGPAQLARLLGYDMPHGVQRVQNWLSRGIPSKVKVERPDIFLAHLQHQHAGESAQA
jgi:hypothetical protein